MLSLQAQDVLELEIKAVVGHSMLALGTQLRSSAGAAIAFLHRAIVQAPNFNLLEVLRESFIWFSCEKWIHSLLMVIMEFLQFTTLFFFFYYCRFPLSCWWDKQGSRQSLHLSDRKDPYPSLAAPQTLSHLCLAKPWLAKRASFILQQRNWKQCPCLRQK